MESFYKIILSAQLAEEIGMGTWMNLKLTIDHINAGESISKEDGLHICWLLNNPYTSSPCSVVLA